MGYKNHSEIGWVLREYNNLIDEAKKAGIESPEKYYDDGKIKGKSSRDKGAGLSAESKKVRANAGYVTDTNPDLGDLKDEEYNKIFLNKPSFNGIPGMIEKITAVEIPKFIYGFKFFHKK
ncbi:MAG TPA: hypothetical protein VIO58_09885 [Candidatus Methanoperedens sp.]